MTHFLTTTLLLALITFGGLYLGGVSRFSGLVLARKPVFFIVAVSTIAFSINEAWLESGPAFAVGISVVPLAVLILVYRSLFVRPEAHSAQASEIGK